MHRLSTTQRLHSVKSCLLMKSAKRNIPSAGIHHRPCLALAACFSLLLCHATLAVAKKHDAASDSLPKGVKPALHRLKGLTKVTIREQYETRVCGPKARSGRVHFRDWRAKLPWSVQRKGSSCRWASFGSRAFPQAQDVIVLLTPDRIDAAKEAYNAPVAWVESLTEKGFYVCVHMPDVLGQKTSFIKDRIAVSWIAVNRFAARKMPYYVGAHHVNLELPNDSARCRDSMPEELNADTHVLLTTGLHPGNRNKLPYASLLSSHDEIDALTTWVQPPANVSAQHEFCIRRPMRATNETIQGARATVVGFKRVKQFAGLTKLGLMNGRACEDVPAPDVLLRRSQIQLSVRLHANDAVRTYERGPAVTAWIAERSAKSFTICAQTVGADSESRTRNSVHVSWIVLPEAPRHGEHCQRVEARAKA
jgi:hypothetical protein